MRVRTFLSLLARNRFRIHILGLAQAYFIGNMSIVNSLLYRIQKLTHGRRIAEAKLTAPPIFIIGHWRSGTTFMHELLVRDPQFGFPNTYQCFAPNHFLISEWLFSRMFSWLLPNKRPMDNMQTGFSRPQEDEFAVCAMGAPTPYLRMAFPNEPAPYMEFFDLEGATDEDLKCFNRAIEEFFAAQTVKHGKRLVLKSPPHTGRIGHFRELFPGSRYIHLVRHPYAMFASTLKLWKTLDRNQGFQIPRYTDEELTDYVLDCFELMYRGYNRFYSRLGKDELIEIKYEDLAQDPLSIIEKIYDTFALEGGEAAKAEIARYVEGVQDYQASKYTLDDATREKINSRWGWFFERYDYPMDSSRHEKVSAT